MTREFLKSLELEDENIEKIIAEHGKTVQSKEESYKKALEAKESELKSSNEQLKEANKAIKSMEGKDADAIKKATEEYEEKIKASELEKKTAKENYEAELKELKYTHALENGLNGVEFSSPFAKEGILSKIKEKGLTIDDNGKIVGLDEVIKDFQSDETLKTCFVFKEEVKEEKPPFIATGTGGSKVNTKIRQQQLIEEFQEANKARNRGEMSRITRVAHEEGIKLA